MSKSSAAEQTFLRHLKERMAEGEIRCIVSGKVACELHHPRYPQSLWECGTGLKSHDWFVIPLSHALHADFHRLGAQTWEGLHGTHENLLKRFWESVGFEPGPFMSVGMGPKREAWLTRVLARLPFVSP